MSVASGAGDVHPADGGRVAHDDRSAAPLRDVLLVVVGTLYLVLHAGLAWFLEHGG